MQISILPEHWLQFEEQGVQTSLMSTYKSAVQEAWQALFSNFIRVEGLLRESNSAQESQDVAEVQV